MLREQKWIKYANALGIDWKESWEEGRDVEYLKEICSAVAEAARSHDVEDIASVIGQRLRSAAIRPDYPYYEPDDLSSILAARPKNAPKLPAFKAERYREQLEGAWIGRIAGCLLGKPTEGLKRAHIDAITQHSGDKPLSRYISRSSLPENFAKNSGLDPNWVEKRCWIDCIEGAAPVDDDTNYTVFTLKLIETYGKNFTPDDVLEGWMAWIPMLSTCTAERVAYRNAATGMLPPETALYQNPYRERIGAQIRGDFFGYICPGNPELAAEYAWRDASISHVRNGIYGEMMIAAMIAAAAVTDDEMLIIDAGLAQIPEKSRLRRDIDALLGWYREGRSVTRVMDNIHTLYNEYDAHEWCHTISNAMIVVMALLYCEKDLGKAICLAVEAAFDTDCNGATIGSIVGIFLGKNKIDPYWYETFNSRLFTTIIGYTDVTIQELVDKTSALVQAPSNYDFA